MIKRYYSSYTGKQIDEAVKTIVENQISLEDLSPELIAEIKRWIAEGEGIEGVRELEFKNHYEFPSMGDSNTLYIAVDEEMMYLWSTTYNCYRVVKSPAPDLINGGGAEE